MNVPAAALAIASLQNPELHACKVRCVRRSCWRQNGQTCAARSAISAMGQSE